MRLMSLNLARYGKFTDVVLDFGEKQPGKPDFHVIYGPNEAGKTTALAGFLDLVYGISKGSKYDFKHKDAMAVGGVLQFAGGATREFLRIKKATNSLLDPGGHVVSDTAILGDLESLARADYQMKFSLDAERLKDGGVDILKSKGDLGQLLFAASASVAGLSEKLNQLNSECEAIYKKRGQKTEVAELKKHLEELAAEKTRLDMAWKAYTKIAATRDDYADRYEKAREKKKEAQIALSKIDRLETTVPRLTTLEEISGKLEVLADVPDDQPELKETVETLRTDELRLEGEMKAAVAAIETLEEELADISVDEAALGLADKLKSLDTFRARYKTAEDLPKRKETADELAGEIAGFLREIGRKGEADPVSLLLDVSVTAPLRELAASRSGVETALKTASDEVAKAQTKLKSEGDKLRDIKAEAGVTDPDALALLGVLALDIRKGNFEGAVRLAAKSVGESRQVLVDAMKPLAPWRGSSDDLGALKIPNAGVITLWTANLDTADQAVKTAKTEIVRIEKELASNRARREASAAVAGVISDGEAAQKRSDREAAWAEHRRKLDGETADAFEARLRADDVAVGLRFSHASEVAKINATLEAITLNEGLLEQAGILLGEAEKARETAREEVAAAMTAVSCDLPPTMAPDDFSIWVEAVKDAVIARSDLLKDESSLNQAFLDRDNARTRLVKAMTKAGVVHAVDDDIEEILLIADKSIAEASAIKNLVGKVTDASKQLDERKEKLDEAQKAFDSWTEKWATLVASCWIGATHKNPSTTLVSEILLKLSDLGAKLEEHEKMLVRIESMKVDRSIFAQKIEALAAEMSEAIDGRSVIAVDDRLAARAKLADEQDLKRSGKRADLEKAQKKEMKLASKIADALGPKQIIFDRLGVVTLADAEKALELAKEKAGLLIRKSEEEAHILKALGKSSMAEAEAALKDLDLTALADEKSAAEDLLNEASTRQQDLFAEKSKLEAQLEALGGDDAVALIEEKRRAIFLDIEDKARRWLRMRTGIIATEFALRNYRDNHKSSMLAKTSDAFATITRGAYSGLTTQADGAGEVLYGMPTDGGGARKADELSKGTQFQLYLALRIAGYHEYANMREPPSGVPFVADDIMEPFDDDRSEEAFGLLAEMAEVGQVIYLTHHQHLCAIAQKVCPNVTLHRLP
jgi:uncharacterized protein YhaN